MSFALSSDPERLNLLKMAYAIRRLEILEDAERLEASFIDFVEAAWPSIDSAEYQPSWAIEGLCEHLQAVADGEILRLVANFPPRCGKTNVVSICWPAWVWARAARSFWSGPSVKFLCGSYSDKLTLQNSNMCRRLLLSPWYQARWGKRFKLQADQNTKTQFDTSEGGSRVATSVGGTLLGVGGDVILCFPAYELVWTEVGPMPIGDVVNGRLKLRAWSLDRASNQLELRRIVAWHRNPGRPLVRVRTSDGGSVTCTADHRILTPNGYVEASALRPGSPVLASCSHVAPAKRQVEMSPCSASADVRNRRQADAEFLGERRVRIIVACRNLADQFFGQMRCAIAKRPVTFAVSNVLRPRAVMDVAKAWVRSVAVSVADFLSFGARADECFSDHLMAEPVVGLSIEPHRDAGISLVEDDGEDFLRNGVAVSHAQSAQAFYAAETGHFVQPFKADDRSPRLVRVIGVDAIHEIPPATYCVTVEGNHNLCCGTGSSILCANCDDPHNVTDVESDAERQTSLNWWSELRSTRLNDPKRSAIVLIMQRLHEEDVTGHVLSGEDAPDWTHFMVPMRYDWGRHCVTALSWNDPRGCDDAGDPLVVPIDEDPFRIPRDVPAAVELDEVRQGELMWPERFGEREVRALERELGPYRASGRLQQQPTPDKGGIFQRDWWQLWQPANGKFPPFTYVVGSIDTAFTKQEENDPSALTVYGVWRTKQNEPRLMLIHAWRKFLQMHGSLPLQGVGERTAEYLKRCRKTVPQQRGESDRAYLERLRDDWGLVEWVADTCRRFKVDKLLIEGKASGLTAADELRRIHGREGWSIQVEPVHGDKRARALAVQPVWSQGMVYAPARDWAELVIYEMENFPKGARDDLTDSSTQAVKHLRDVGFAPRPEEAAAEEADRSRYRKKREPLYPGMRG